MATLMTGTAGDNGQKALDALKEQWKSDLGKIDEYVPKTGATTHYEKLIKAVQISTKKNENIAQLRDRITKLGESVVNLAKLLKVI
jgi:hypothetical protein